MWRGYIAVCRVALASRSFVGSLKKYKSGTPGSSHDQPMKHRRREQSVTPEEDREVPKEQYCIASRGKLYEFILSAGAYTA